MPRTPQSPTLSPGQAHYVLERLLADRRISHADVQRYLGYLQREIADTETRLRALRSMTASRDGDASSAKGTANASKIPRRHRRKHSAEGRLGLRFSGLIRHLPVSVRAAMKRVRLERGVEAAIAAAQAAAK